MPRSRADDFIRLEGVGADVNAVRFDLEEIAGVGRNFHADSIAVDGDGIVARRDDFDNFRHVDEAVVDGGIGRLVALNGEDKNGFPVEVGVGASGIGCRAPSEVLDNLRAGLGEVNFFGKIEGESGVARAVLAVEERNGVAADRRGAESRAEFAVDAGKSGLQLPYFNEVVSVNSHNI